MAITAVKQNQVIGPEPSDQRAHVFALVLEISVLALVLVDSGIRFMSTWVHLIRCPLLRDASVISSVWPYAIN